MAVQAAESGAASVIYNPKPVDSYRGFVDAVDGELIEIDCTAEGRLDPFRFAPSAAAAQISADHLTACVPSLRAEEQIRLRVGLLAAARAGASCVGEALDHPEVPSGTATLIRAAAAATPMVAAGIASSSGPRWGAPARGRVTVIEAGGGTLRPERAAVA